MNYQQTLLIRLMEEASELAQSASKALLFGLNHNAPTSKLTNGQKINNEYNDLLGTIEELKLTGFILTRDEWEVKAKQEKIRYYTTISIEQGVILSEEDLKNLTTLGDYVSAESSIYKTLEKITGSIQSGSVKSN